ncbi:MAG TPA: MSMEG_1061 family FMN-dependent PPOX-type flavoprotein [Candidatus Binataceae bacterium]
MDAHDSHKIDNVKDLRAVLGEPHSMTSMKLWCKLEAAAIEFIKASPFLLLSTADKLGNQDISPKGDGAGFVAVENENTILIPDRKGNRLLFGLQNILENPHVGIIFLLPGTDETLRANGRAELTADPDILKRLSARGQPALIAIRVRVEECFFHCAKAFRRSRLWQADTWPEPQKISFGKMFASKVGGGESLAAKIDARIEEDYKNNL